MAVLLIGLAAIPGISVTRRLSWPYDPDAFRDIAAAQAVRNGSWWSDPFYAGAALWYSPLVPAVVALLSWLARLPVALVDVRGGPWLNLAAPVTFFSAAWRLVGVAPALCALTVFLFLPLDAPAWAAGTYTPWLFPGLVAQSLLYIGLVGVAAVLEVAVARRAVLMGLTVAVAFLAHPGAGIMLAATLGVSVLWQWWRAGTITSPIRIIGIAGVVALALTSPLLLPLLVRYRLHVFNMAPATWGYPEGRPAALLSTLRQPGVWILLGLASTGAWTLRTRRSAGTAVVWSWGIVAVALSVYSLAAERGIGLPPLVPAYHFEFQVRAWGWMLIGVGAWALVSTALPDRVGSHGLLAVTLCSVLCLGTAAALYPFYLRRPAFTQTAAVARDLGVSSDREASRWIAGSTPANAVVLASDEDGLYIVGPAGRRVVAVDAFFSNPYVDLQSRRNAREQMFAALASGDGPAFDVLAHQYGVTHVLARDGVASKLLESDRLQPAFGTSELTLFRVSSGGR